MVIIIGNQKGGAGKSTLTILLANYLTMVKGYDVTVLDMDYQKSIYQLYEKAKILENEEPYEVVEVDLEYFTQVLSVLNKNKDKIILIDLPGKLDDNNLIPVFQNADLFLTPFTYDEFTFNSTITFSLLVQHINQKAKKVFIPNRIKTNVKYETKAAVDEQLLKLGSITESIADRIDFSRTTTYSTPLGLFNTIIPIFEGILETYIVPVVGEGKEVNNE